MGKATGKPGRHWEAKKNANKFKSAVNTYNTFQQHSQPNENV